MDVFWHKDVSRYNEAVMLTHLFQILLEDEVTGSAFEERRPLETAERDEVKMVGMLITGQTAGHDGEMLHPQWSSLPQGAKEQRQELAGICLSHP
jgi:hypothetical protein